MGRPMGARGAGLQMTIHIVFAFQRRKMNAYLQTQTILEWTSLSLGPEPDPMKSKGFEKALISRS